jgi:hypothetical protein
MLIFCEENKMITKIFLILLFIVILYCQFPLEVKGYPLSGFSKKFSKRLYASHLFQKDDADNERLIGEIRGISLSNHFVIYSIVIYGYSNRYFLYHDIGGVDEAYTDKAASRLYRNLVDSNHFKEQFEKYSELISLDCLHTGESGNYCSRCGAKLK